MAVGAAVLNLLGWLGVAVVVVLQLCRTVCADQARHQLVGDVPSLPARAQRIRMAVQSRNLPLNVWRGVLTDDTARPCLIVIAKLSCIPSQIHHLIML